MLSIFSIPPAEQAAIVRFLSWVTARLDRASRAKRKVIALLNEQKQAIIHRAVTRGIDPTVSLKPSGIPWLGGIPEHWEVRRLGHAIRLQTGFPFASSGFAQGEDIVRLLRGINVTPGGIRWDAVVRWQRRPNDGLDEFALGLVTSYSAWIGQSLAPAFVLRPFKRAIRLHFSYSA